MLYEIIHPISDYIIAKTFDEAAFDYFKINKKSQKLVLTDHVNTYSYDITKTNSKKNLTKTQVPTTTNNNNMPSNTANYNMIPSLFIQPFVSYPSIKPTEDTVKKTSDALVEATRKREEATRKTLEATRRARISEAEAMRARQLAQQRLIEKQQIDERIRQDQLRLRREEELRENELLERQRIITNARDRAEIERIEMEEQQRLREVQIENQRRADAQLGLRIHTGAVQTGDDGAHGHFAGGVGLRVEKDFSMHHVVRLGA
jgi:hypothetical protein